MRTFSHIITTLWPSILLHTPILALNLHLALDICLVPELVLCELGSYSAKRDLWLFFWGTVVVTCTTSSLVSLLLNLMAILITQSSVCLEYICLFKLTKGIIVPASCSLMI